MCGKGVGLFAQQTVCQVTSTDKSHYAERPSCSSEEGIVMKSDLTCPIEVTSVDIQYEEQEKGQQVVCLIRFLSLEEEKTVDSVQMNIVCFDAVGNRLGGRLVRAHAREYEGNTFFGAFRPEHVTGTARVEAAVEKVWFNDGVLWRREERNVREYESNLLPEGRELDRLRSVAGPDAAGYAVAYERVWLCVCGRANRNDDSHCRRCHREKDLVLSQFSHAYIESTVGEKERMLEAKTRENVEKTTQQNAEAAKEQARAHRRQKRRMRRIIVLLLVIALCLAAWRWLVPKAIYAYADQKLQSGQPMEAKKLYQWVGKFWPGEYIADQKADEADTAIIQNYITLNSKDTLELARTLSLESGKEDLYLESSLALAQLYVDEKKTEEAENVLVPLSGNEGALAMLQEIRYQRAMEDKENLRYESAIDGFLNLGTYLDSQEQYEDSIYLYARSLMREEKLEEASEQFIRIPEYRDSLSLLRSCRYRLAGNKRKAGELIEAASLYESLGIYEDAERLGKACRYEAGMSAIAEGNFIEAAEQLKMAEDYEDAVTHFNEAALTVGSTALTQGEYETAIFWLEQLPMTDEVLASYHEAVYAYAGELLKAGSREEAATTYRSLGEYQDASTWANEIEYQLATEAFSAGAYEEALDRFEGLGTFKDSQDQVKRCIRTMAEKAYREQEFEKALTYYEQMEETEEVKRQIVHCYYELAGQLAEKHEYAEAAKLYEQCGTYSDAQDKAEEMAYMQAVAYESEGRYQEAAAAFRALSYLDAAQRAVKCEDLWLADIYRNAKLDLETGNYLSVMDAIKDIKDETLPARYSDLPGMYEEACLGRALELIDINRPLDALPFLEEIKDNKTAKKRLEDYVYRIIGRWKEKNGIEYIFRRDGTCRINGTEGYYGGTKYEIRVGEEPYPTVSTYQVVNLRNNVLTIKELGSGRNIRLSYVGEPTEKTDITEPAETQSEADTGLLPETSEEAAKTE